MATAAPPAGSGVRFTVDQYHRLIQLGVLTEGDGVELLFGQILHKGGWRDGRPAEYRFSPEQCLRMVAAGVVTRDEAFALAEEGAAPDMPRSPAHDSAIDRLDDELRPLVPLGWRLRIQSAVRLTGGEPEPDLAVVMGPAGRYDAHHPRPDEIALVVEVSDSTLQYDRTLKHRAYALARLPVYWIVNLEDRQVEVFSGPKSGDDATYTTATVYRAGEYVPVVIAGNQVGTVAVVSLLP